MRRFSQAHSDYLDPDRASGPEMPEHAPRKVTFTAEHQPHPDYRDGLWTVRCPEWKWEAQTSNPTAEMAVVMAEIIRHGAESGYDGVEEPPVDGARISGRYDTPHTDESGASAPLVIARVLDDSGTGGETVMHLTPKEKREYEDGMARMAEMD